MGLACSHTIVRAMGGDIVLKQSSPGLTEFAFKVPALEEDLPLNASPSPSNLQDIQMLFGNRKQVSEGLKILAKHTNVGSLRLS
jgi:hypothetical protein